MTIYFVFGNLEVFYLQESGAIDQDELTIRQVLEIDIHTTKERNTSMNVKPGKLIRLLNGLFFHQT